MDWKRSIGDLARHRITMLWSASGTASNFAGVTIGGTGWCTC
jgi:hypothetical protein